EDAVVGTAVGVTASASDDDATTNAITYSLDDDAGGLFAIHSSTGVVTVNAALDYETATSHNVIVRATSADTSFSTQSFSITVTDVNEAGVSAISDTDGTADLVAENSVNGTAVGVTAFASDPDGTDSVSYSLDDDASGRFAIDTNTGLVTVAAGLDREAAASCDITVRATSTDTSFTTKAFTISIGDVDEFDVTAPTDSDGTADAVNENAANGTVVGITGFATDDDATTNGVTYSLFDNAGGRFAIDGSTGIVTVADGTQLNREAAASHNITVRATSADGSTADTVFTVNLNDVDEFDTGAVTDIDGTANSVAEDATVGTVVGVTASASDDDATTNAITYTLDDDAGGLFAVHSGTGIVTVADGTLLDRETTASHNITVRAASSDGSSSTQVFAINVNDVDEFNVGAVTDVNGIANAIDENAANGTLVGITASATDADATNNTITYTLDDNAGGRFAINGASGIVTVADGTQLDREAAASHDITVRATSADGSTNDTTFTINVNDVDEFDVTAPVDVDGTADTVNENTANGSAVGITPTASDADATTNGIAYSLFDNAGGRFTIDGTTGIVTVADDTLLDREAAAAHDITVRATSADGSIADTTFTINLIDVDEFDVTPPTDVDGTANAVDENAANGTVVGITAFSADADATTNGITYSMFDDAGGRFAIDANSGAISVAGAIDFEAATSHSVTVQATSIDGSTATRAFSIAVRDVDEFDVTAISDTDAAVDRVTENSPLGTLVGVVAFALDADGSNNAVAYSLDDDAGGRVEIDSASGLITVAGAIDFETSPNYTISVRATSTDGSISTANFTIAVTDQNDNRPVITPGQSFSVSEFAANGISLGSMLATDVDTVGSITDWGIVSGNEAGVFAIDPQSGELTVADNSSVNFESTSSYVLTLVVADGLNQSTSQTVQINVVDENDAPIAAADAYAVSEDTTLTVDVTAGLLRNDSDEDGQPMSVFVVSGPSHGSLSLAANGAFVYTPDADFNGTDAFQYSATDGTLQTTVTEARVTVQSVNDTPVGMNDSFSFDQLSSLTTSQSVLLNDTDIEGDDLQAVLVNGPSNGTLILNVDGTFTYTPNQEFSGTDSFEYQADDGTGVGNVARVVIVVQQTVTSAGPSQGNPSNDSRDTNTAIRETSNRADGTTDDEDLIVLADATAVSQAKSSQPTTPSAIIPPEEALVVQGELNSGSPLGETFELREQSSKRDTTDRSAVERTRSDTESSSRESESTRDKTRTQLEVLSAESRQFVQHLDRVGLWKDFDTFQDEVATATKESVEITELVVEATTVSGAALTVGYVAWLLRSGSIVMSMVSSLPAWTMMDPLAILQGGARDGNEEGEDDSLQSLLRQRQ
ncbi:MAG: cadherin domain-containing protein, partial [Planctomycetota bacterium]|nr:cadherin domain-containing protein [Planctomycetota bacterium]